MIEDALSSLCDGYGQNGTPNSHRQDDPAFLLQIHAMLLVSLESPAAPEP